MMLQEEVKFDMYFRCYSIDQRNVRIMPYEPRHPYHLRYQTEWQTPPKIFAKGRARRADLESISRLRLEHGRVRHPRWRAGGDRFLQSGARRGSRSVGQANFDWVVEAVSDMAIRKAREHVPGRDNLSWGKFVQAAVMRTLRELA